MEEDEFDTVMQEIGSGRVQRYAMITLGLLQMLTIHETMGMGILSPAAVCDLHMSLAQVSTLNTAPFFGIICSSYFWGYITDKMGRRWTLLRTIILSNLCSVVSMFMPSFTSFFVMRFITGIFVAGPSFVAVTYLSEFCSKKVLAGTVTHMYMFTGFAMCYCPIWATLYLSSGLVDFDIDIVGNLTFRPWRLLGCMYMLPGLVAFFLLLRMRESPKFLFMIGDTNQAMNVMEWISVKNTKHNLSHEQVKLMNDYQEKQRMHRHARSNSIVQTMLHDSVPLFRAPYVCNFVGCCMVMFSCGLVSNGLGIWYTAMRNIAHMRQDDTSKMTMCKVLFKQNAGDDVEDDVVVACNDGFKGFSDSFVLGVCYIVMFNICYFLLLVFKRKALFVIILVISSSCGFTLIFVIGPWAKLFCFAFFVCLPGLVVSLMGGALIQFVPTHLRAKALCIGLMWTRCGAVTGSLVIGVFIERNCEMTLLAIAVFPIFSASIESFLPL